MAQISEQNNSSNHEFNSYDQMGKNIVNLGSKKGKENTIHHPKSPIYRINH